MLMLELVSREGRKRKVEIIRAKNAGFEERGDHERSKEGYSKEK